MLSVGGIPSRTTQCGATLNPRGGGLDDTANIQAAVNSCPAGQVVQLGAGTFTVGDGNTIKITKGITLRGSGSCNNSSSPYCATYIQRTDGCKPLSPSSNGSCGATPSSFIWMGNTNSVGGSGNYVTSTNLAADAAQGATSVQVASAAGFSVGQTVLLDETPNESWVTDYDVGGSTKIWAGDRVVWMKHNPAWGSDDFSSTQYPSQSGTAGCWFSIANTAYGGNRRCDHSLSEIKKIASISGTTITFDSPVTISYRTSHSAQLSYFNYPFVSGMGVENISFYGADASAVTLVSAINSWVYKIECKTTLGVNNVFNEAACVAIDELLRFKLNRCTPMTWRFLIRLTQVTGLASPWARRRFSSRTASCLTRPNLSRGSRLEGRTSSPTTSWMTPKNVRWMRAG